MNSIVFLIYGVMVFMLSPLYIIKVIKRIKEKSFFINIAIILGGTSIVMSAFFSLGIAIYKTKTTIWGFIICLIISVISIFLLKVIKKN